eukprot:gb/GECH01001910.1/.p1 GENE.gb/GECH01001910.1/~~gb/GECH01001910.1/.p1  ORF type:complete len:427 (+),score=108.25 gb/GECH01001910.1/:1-1281(+)
MRIAFLHPDLGIGGAERLVVDAAVSLQKRGHDVHMFTAQHNPDHCFSETRDGTIPVTVYGDFIPRTIFGYLHVLCAIVKMIWLSLCVIIKYRSNFDVIFCDQVPVPLILFKLLTSSRLLYYIHFPDKLLASRGKFVRKAYRYIFDRFEEFATQYADRLLVNSKFTASIVSDAFPSLAHRVDPDRDVLYPALQLQRYDQPPSHATPASPPRLQIQGCTAVVSVNRFERKKNVGLAIDAFAALKEKLGDTVFTDRNLVLVIAGGYDPRLTENVQVRAELEKRAFESGLSVVPVADFDAHDTREAKFGRVVFLENFNDAERFTLFHESQVVVYTPSEEHFGIVPIEAQYCQRGVVAVNSGGPLESIVHNQTGLLAPPTSSKFSEAIADLLTRDDAPEMAKRGRKRVIDLFSIQVFGEKLDSVLHELMNN